MAQRGGSPFISVQGPVQVLRRSVFSLVSQEQDSSGKVLVGLRSRIPAGRGTALVSRYQSVSASRGHGASVNRDTSSAGSNRRRDCPEAWRLPHGGPHSRAHAGSRPTRFGGSAPRSRRRRAPDARGPGSDEALPASNRTENRCGEPPLPGVGAGHPRGDQASDTRLPWLRARPRAPLRSVGEPAGEPPRRSPLSPRESTRPMHPETERAREQST